MEAYRYHPADDSEEPTLLPKFVVIRQAFYVSVELHFLVCACRIDNYQNHIFNISFIFHYFFPIDSHFCRVLISPIRLIETQKKSVIAEATTLNLSDGYSAYFENSSTSSFSVNSINSGNTL